MRANAASKPSGQQTLVYHARNSAPARARLLDGQAFLPVLLRAAALVVAHQPIGLTALSPMPLHRFVSLPRTAT